MTALGAVIMALGAMVEVLDLSVCVLASLIVVFIYLEIGSPYTWLTWLATSLISFLIFPGKTVWLNYFLVFGVYPLLKAYIEKLPRAVWLIIKLVYANAVIVAMFFLMELIFGVPLFEKDALWLKAVLYVVINVAFIAYDVFISMAVRIYFLKIRPRIASMLK
jgi:hypothetical protein